MTDCSGYRKEAAIKLAAIDIGTNSTRLLISELKSLPSVRGGVQFSPLIREMKITRLGKDLEKTGCISSRGADDTVQVLRHYLDLMGSNNVTRFRIVGTRVLRSAKNSAWFTDKVKRELGADVEIISGEDEAKLAFNGVVKGFLPELPAKIVNCRELSENAVKGNIFVTDIGGGSTEFIIGNPEGGISYLNSIPLGSVMVSELFLDDKKPPADRIREMSAFIFNNLSEVPGDIKKRCFSYAVGLAGTVSALASVELGLDRYEREKIHGHILKYEKVLEIQKLFCSMDLENRKNIRGLEKERADIIVGGTAILIEIMKILSIEKLTACENDILDGVVYSIF
jgi:exopolyphosphatase/guanosine-5'-triphosphate,3'-diphosphate pyrophosphatase